MAPTQIEVPSDSFPGSTPEASNAAFPSGKQPPTLRYWPQLNYDEANRTLLGCSAVKVLHSTGNQWPGLCINLNRNTQIETASACKDFCYAEPRCSVWQHVNQTFPGQCWVGFGTNCGNRRGDDKSKVTIEMAERIQHGEVTVLKSLAGWKIANLYNLGFFSEVLEQRYRIWRCKAWCYSSIACEYWQYSASQGGCWVDARLFSTNQGKDPDNVVQYPMTTSDGGATPDPRYTVGEYIAHYCPAIEQPTAPPSIITPSPTYSSENSGPSSFFWWIFGLIVVALGIAGTVYYIQQQRTGAKAARGRSKARRPEMDPDAPYSEEGKPLMQMTPKPPPTQDSFAPASYSQSPAPAAQITSGYGAGYGPSMAASSVASSRQGASQQPGFSSSQQYSRPAAYSNFGHGGSSQVPHSQWAGGGSSQVPQNWAGGSTQAPQGGMGMPPPTQLVDFGQGGSATTRAQPASSLAPTQLLQPGGLPFPSAGQYAQPRSRAGTGM
eukprot:CAMPEP_0206488266 /NCGR_PEP_ID=MMETSP0324_2-20121206/42279_1 /ASSEMBLY_ACC=CAM_ASM_000836 /TAXON_ID=2866 /ORGANISM="Crypthecodinium cohnii, Strain Seligo" /LENGTH=493 /DNA_ID=CAMNT_0053967195 /DNA_START=152 /DNA_END=1633 /DNA_ORIENTATION=-